MAVETLRPTDAPAVKDLRSTIQGMDALSQEGFTHIASIASLAMLALEAGGIKTPAQEDVYQALQVISGKAQDIENCINSEAENVGCNYIDPRRRAKLLEPFVGVEHGH